MSTVYALVSTVRSLRLVVDAYKNRFLENWGTLTSLRKPIIAAVSGYAVRFYCTYCLCLYLTLHIM